MNQQIAQGTWALSSRRGNFLEDVVGEKRKSYKEGCLCVVFGHTGGGFQLVSIGDKYRVVLLR